MNANGTAQNSTSEELLQLRLAELCRLYDISLDLIGRATTPDELVDRILDEYISRFEQIPGTDLAEAKRPVGAYEKEKIRALVMFATQAVGLKENADVYEQLRHSNEELKRVTGELRATNRKLKALNRHYLNMLGFVSHEIRSPLISILGFAELLQEGMLGKLNTEQENAVGIITRVSKELIAMVRNYLDLSKIECGELRLKCVPVDLVTEVIDPVLAEMREQLARRKMRVKKKLAQGTRRLELVADRELLKIVFVNLLSNALKYGEEGTEILLEASRDEDGVHIAITNQGPGVPEAQLGKIFEKFTRAEDPETGGTRGTGLGLFNTRWIIEAHRGRIWAESKHGEWFRVHFVLPLRTRSSRCHKSDRMESNGDSASANGEGAPSSETAISSPS